MIDALTTASALFQWGAPDPAASLEPGRLCVIGAPTDHGNAISRGAASGPSAIRRASRELGPPCVTGYDLGDVASAGTTDLSAFLERLQATTVHVLSWGLCPLTLGGDHSITFAPVSTLQQSREICLVWFDAHTDFSLWSGRGSHNHKQVLRRISDLDGVGRIVQVGYRGITRGDERSLGRNAVVVTSAQAREMDADALLSLIPEHLPCYISIDIDAVDPLWAPGTSAPVPDGLLPAEIRSMIGAIVRNRRVCGADLVEVNPRLDVGGQTSRVAAELLHEIADAWKHQAALPRLDAAATT